MRGTYKPNTNFSGEPNNNYFFLIGFTFELNLLKLAFSFKSSNNYRVLNLVMIFSIYLKMQYM